MKIVWNIHIFGGSERNWRRLGFGSIPLWVIHRVYKYGFPDKWTSIARDHYILKGTIYEYLIKVRDLSITEPIAQVHHLEVLRRKKR